MKYPKINSLWKREAGEKKGKLIIGEYSLPEFCMIKQWQVQEKIDGTNIRINVYSVEHGTEIEFHGRTDEAMMPPKLLAYLQSYFTIDRFKKAFHTNEEIYLYGEGYGAKIQCGGNYRKDMGFILFDVKIGSWWLKQEDVKEIAQKLDIPYAPIIGTMSEEEIITYIKSKPSSLCSETPQIMEGVIVRSDPLLLLRNGERLMWKLKCIDFGIRK